jgi:voltage-gated potassium channel
MLWVAPDRWRWVREHPLEVIVVVLTPPFLLSALQPVRLLRLLRLLRLAPLVHRLFRAQGLRYTALVEEYLLAEFRELAARMANLERALEQRLRA